MEMSRAIYPHMDESGLSSDALSRDIKIEFCTEDAWLCRTLGLVGKMVSIFIGICYLSQGLIPELGRSPGEGNGSPLQYSCLENLTDRGALPGFRECLAGYSPWGCRVRYDLATNHHRHCMSKPVLRNWKNIKRYWSQSAYSPMGN